MNFPSAANGTTQTSTSTRPSNLPTSIIEVDPQLEAKKTSKDHAAKMEGPSIGNIPCTADETTWPKRGPSDLPSSFEEAGREGDLFSEETNSQLIENVQPVQLPMEIPDPEANWRIAPNSKIPRDVKSYVEVKGEWLPSTRPTPFRNFEVSKPVETSLKDSEVVRDSAKIAQPGLLDDVKYSENVTSDQSFQLPEPSTNSPEQSSRTEANASRSPPKFQANASKTAININGAKLLSELELFLKETGTIRTEKKPIKFKDAVGRKFSFPFELAETWGVSIIISSCFVKM